MKSAVPMNEFGITEKGGIAVVSSRYVADVFGRRHDDVLKAIRNAISPTSGLSADFSARNFAETLYKDEQRKIRPEYIMTKDGFAVVVMGFTGKKAMQFKEAYIARFKEMEEFIKNLSVAKMEFPMFTNTIMELHEEPKHYHFSNEIDMINRIVTGRSAKQIREEHGLQKGESIRPFLTNEQIAAVRMLQTADVGLMVAKLPFDARKKTLTDYHRNSISGKYLKAPCTKLLQA